MIQSGLWITDNFESLTKTYFENLYDREKDCDIEIVSFIEANFKLKRLFYTINHPTAEILHEISDSIMKHLNLNMISDQTKILTKNALNSTEWIIPSKIAETLSFSNSQRIKIENTQFDTHDFVKLHYNYYSGHKNILTENSTRIYENLNPIIQDDLRNNLNQLFL